MLGNALVRLPAVQKKEQAQEQSPRERLTTNQKKTASGGKDRLLKKDGPPKKNRPAEASAERRPVSLIRNIHTKDFLLRRFRFPRNSSLNVGRSTKDCSKCASPSTGLPKSPPLEQGHCSRSAGPKGMGPRGDRARRRALARDLPGPPGRTAQAASAQAHGPMPPFLLALALAIAPPYRACEERRSGRPSSTQHKHRAPRAANPAGE